jgi:hypothetical protein
MDQKQVLTTSPNFSSVGPSINCHNKACVECYGKRGSMLLLMHTKRRALLDPFYNNLSSSALLGFNMILLYLPRIDNYYFILFIYFIFILKLV